MYYISSTPNASGNYGNPTSTPFENSLMLPDEFLSKYIEYKGFVILTATDEQITSIRVNQRALDDYFAEYPDVKAEDIPSESEQLRADIDYLAIMMGVEL